MRFTCLRLALAAACCLANGIGAAKFAVLDFWGAGGFVHDSRLSANKFLDSLAKAMDFELVKSQDPSVFTREALAKYDVVVLNHVSKMGLVLNAAQRTAALEFFRAKGTVAWHGSGDIQNSWPEYQAFLGCQFTAHGANTQTATLRRDPAAAPHPAAQGPEAVTLDEEWYSYSRSPRAAPGVTVLYALDESTCRGCGPAMGDHPIVWTVESKEGGRFFHSGMGHKDDVFLRYAFTKAVLAQAIAWASEAGAPSALWVRGAAQAAWEPGRESFRLDGRAVPPDYSPKRMPAFNSNRLKVILDQ